QRGRYLMRRRAGLAIEKEKVLAQWIACQRHHAAQLAGAEHAYGQAGVRGSGCASTASVCVCRYAASAAATRASCNAMMPAANSAALAAPAAPMAKVATGMP